MRRRGLYCGEIDVCDAAKKAFLPKVAKKAPQVRG